MNIFEKFEHLSLFKIKMWWQENQLMQWFSNFLYSLPPENTLNSLSDTVMTNIRK